MLPFYCCYSAALSLCLRDKQKHFFVHSHLMDNGFVYFSQVFPLFSLLLIAKVFHFAHLNGLQIFFLNYKQKRVEAFL